MSGNEQSAECGHCMEDVNVGDFGVMCEKCDKWFHIECQNIDSAAYDEMGTSSSPWRCTICVEENLLVMGEDLSENETSVKELVSVGRPVVSHKGKSGVVGGKGINGKGKTNGKTKKVRELEEEVRAGRIEREEWKRERNEMMELLQKVSKKLFEDEGQGGGKCDKEQKIGNGVLVIGDSMLGMAKENLEEKGMKVEMYSGMRVGGVWLLIPSIKKSFVGELKAIILMLGTNNIKAGMSKGDLEIELGNEMAVLLRKCKKEFGNELKIGVMGILKRKDVGDGFVNAANSGIERACKAEGGLFVDGGQWVTRNEIDAKGLHLTKEGGMILSSLIGRVSEKLQSSKRLVGSEELLEKGGGESMEY